MSGAGQTWRPENRVALLHHPWHPAGYTREDLATLIRTEFGTYRWLLEPLIEAAGFKITDADVRGRIYAAYTCIAV